MTEALEIPPTPETESDDRHFWDVVLRSLAELSEMQSATGEDLDLFWVLDELRDADRDERLDVVYGNYVMMIVPEGESASPAVENLLIEHGILEKGEA